MARFTTRVELYGVQHDSIEYEVLHKAMEELKFYRIIIDDQTNERFHLPPAEYNSVSDTLTRSQVADLAEKAAIKTGKNYSILVTESDGRAFINLKPA